MRQPPKLPRPTPVPRVLSPTIQGLGSEKLDAFWADTPILPIIEPGPDPDTMLVTFCWRDPDAEAVLLFANRLTDETHLADTLLEKLPDTDLWHATFRMSTRWRASYAFLVAELGQRPPWETADGHVALRSALDRGRPDPRNPDSSRNRAGHLQSVVSGPAAPSDDLIRPRSEVRAGKLTELTGPGERRAWIYDPPGHASASDVALPLLIVLDGEVWTTQQSLPTILDNLAAQPGSDCQPIRAARALFIDSGGTDQRWADLSADGAAADEVAQTWLPWLAERRALPSATDIAIVGQSLGGLTALRTVLRHGDRIGAAIAQSASLWQDDLTGELTGELGQAETGAYVHLAHGEQEWVLAEPHRDLARRLRAAGHDVHEMSYDGGHDYACWRVDLADAVSAFLRR